MRLLSILSFTAIGLVAATAAAQGTITSGGARFEVTSFSATSSHFVNFETSTGIDHQYAVAFFYRVGNTGPETSLGSPTMQSFTGNVMTLDYADVGGLGLAVRIEATLSEPMPGAAQLGYRVTVINGGLSARALNFFVYADFDVDGSSTGDTATLITGLPNPQIDVVDAPATVTMSGSAVAAWQVAAYPTLQSSLTDAAPTTLSSSGLPFGPGDFTAAFSWTTPIGVGVTRTFSFVTSVVESAVCGDGTVQTGETCDDGFTDACGTCNATCTGPGTASICGDGSVCPETETCDDGFADACGTCNATCTGIGTGSICGDGAVCMETETCDDGFTDACGTCNADCTGAGMGSTCGDSMICDETEECDDGNVSNGDGCSDTCVTEMLPDAGPTNPDGGAVDASVGDAGGPPPPLTRGRDGGCCRVGGGSSTGTGAAAGLLALMTLLARRRRRRTSLVDGDGVREE
jgi:MYXO-CTERM domain-containing protein